MSQIQPLTVEEILPAGAPPLDGASARRAGSGVPQWLRLLLANPKSRGGLIVLAGMILVAIFAPLIATHDPAAFSLEDAEQSPSWNHLFGTTDQGTDVFSQVVIGARTSLFLGCSAAVLATILATTPRHPRRLRRRRGRRRHQLPDERLPRDPDDPAADRRVGLPAEPRPDDDDPDPRPDAVGVRGAHPARPGADAAQPRLRPRRQGCRRVDAGASSSAS